MYFFRSPLACNFTEDELKSNFATAETKLTYQWVLYYDRS